LSFLRKLRRSQSLRESRRVSRVLKLWLWLLLRTSYYVISVSAAYCTWNIRHTSRYSKQSNQMSKRITRVLENLILKRSTPKNKNLKKLKKN